MSVAPARAIVDVGNVSKHYGEGDACVDALNDVDLVVRAGEVVALPGPSGSGKTTCSTSSAASSTQAPARSRWTAKRFSTIAGCAAICAG